jgi:hypothetical protein
VKTRLTCAFVLALILALAFAACVLAADDDDAAPDPTVIAFITGQQAQPQDTKADEQPAEQAQPAEEAAPSDDAAPVEEAPADETAIAEEAQPADEDDAQAADVQVDEDAEEPVEEPAEEVQPPATPEQDVSAGLEMLETVDAEKQAEQPAKPEKKVGEFFGPLQTRSMHPLHQYFFNFPADRARTLKKGRAEFAVHLQFASNMLKETSGGSIVDLDLENWNYQFELRKSAWGGEITAIVPLRDNTHGFMDNIIENWHSMIGLPGGLRPDYPQNDYHFFVSDPMGNMLNVPSDQFGLGDISLIWKQEIGDGAPDHAFSYRVGVKLPTGDFDKGLGSGGTDVGAGLAYETLGDRWAGYANLNYIFTSQGDFAGFQVNNRVTGSLASEYRLRPTWWLTGQLDYAQYPLTTGSSLDRDSLELLFGFHKLLEKKLIFSGGFTEDISRESSPDFGIIAEMRWRF